MFVTLNLCTPRLIDNFERQTHFNMARSRKSRMPLNPIVCYIQSNELMELPSKTRDSDGA